MLRFAVFVSLAASLAGACTDNSTGITPTCPPGSTLTYENYGRAVIQTECLACHAAKERPLLGTLQDVQTNRQAILREAVEHTSMPEDGDMTFDERVMLGEWLACGAP